MSDKSPAKGRGAREGEMAIMAVVLVTAATANMVVDVVAEGCTTINIHLPQPLHTTSPITTASTITTTTTTTTTDLAISLARSRATFISLEWDRERQGKLEVWW
jgi:hypothetical protein